MEIENFSSGFLDALSQQAEQAIRLFDSKRIRDILLEVIDGYQSTEEIVDFVSQSHNSSES